MSETFTTASTFCTFSPQHKISLDDIQIAMDQWDKLQQECYASCEPDIIGAFDDWFHWCKSKVTKIPFLQYQRSQIIRDIRRSFGVPSDVIYSDVVPSDVMYSEIPRVNSFRFTYNTK